mmetsp:Transcript_40929/g.57574  ORF Transcript_40929/g.57574 Transcript_40929/m.57574 type:complete len:284 (+) Transcript_40929:251-1102(+)
MANVVENTNGFSAEFNFCMPIKAADDTVVSDDNNSRSETPPPEAEIVLLEPKRVDESEQERDPRRISRIPCKARGVTDTSVPHTARNAYIDIPSNAVHGMMLICSHDVCAKSRRFRYCTVCGIPVAKRNFLKRHGHGLLKARQRVLVPEEPTSPTESRPTKKPRISPDPPPPSIIPPVHVPAENFTKDIDGSILMRVSQAECDLLKQFRSEPAFVDPQTRDAYVQKIIEVLSANRTPPPTTPTKIQLFNEPQLEQPPAQFIITDDISDDSSVDEFIGKWFLEV